jgi:S1-C subfamily serine protease
MMGFVACVIVLAVPPARCQKITRPEMRAKAATALVLGSNGSGTAFCIHESGLFLTHDSIIRGRKEVTLVLRSGQPDQEIMTAKVIRRDPVRELALLRVAEWTHF